jgi:hypothetical protein
MNAKQWLQRVFPAVVSIGALLWLFVFGDIDIATLVDSLTWRVAYVLVPALLVYGAVTLALEAESILWLCANPAAGFGAWTAARVKCASYLVGIINYALGAAALTVLLRRRAGMGLGEAASVVLLISSLDMIVVLGFAGVAAAVFETDAPAVQAGVLAAAGVGFFGGLALLRAPGSLGPLDRIRSLSVFDALRTTPLSVLGRVGVLRVLFSTSFIALSWATFYAFEVSIPVSQLVVGMMIVAVVGALPIAVAGLGTTQVAVLFLFSELADRGTLVALSLGLSAGMTILRIGMGIVFAREFTREALEQTQAHQPSQANQA